MKTLLALTVVMAAILPAAASAQAPGLVAAYGFEEPSGTVAVDGAAGANPGMLAGPARTASGRFGAALSFDGIDDRVNVADSASLDLAAGMTLEAWVHSPTSDWRTALLKERAAGLAYALYASTDTNRPSAELKLGTAVETRGPATLPSGWTHLASTYDGATLRLYVNGVQVSSRAASGLIEQSSGALRIGGNAVWGEYFSGRIDEVRIYSRALAPAEIQADMATPVVPADTQPPTAPSLTASVAGDDVKLSWSGATDDVGVTGYRVYRDDTLIASPGPTAASHTDADRPPGTYRYSVAAVDDAGHVGPRSDAAEVTVLPDTTPPSVSFDYGCNGTNVHDYVDFRPLVSDDRGPVTARVDVDGQTIWGPYSGVTGPRIRLEWTTNGLANGPHTMTVVLRDAAGNETVAPCEWNVHNWAVTVPFTTPSDGDTVRGSVALGAQVLGDGEPLPQDWSTWLPAGSPVGHVRFIVAGVTTLMDTTAPYQVTWDTTKVPNGVYTVRAEVQWMDYSRPRATREIQVVVDNSVPRPTGVTAAVTGDDVRVTWDPAPAGSGVTAYRVLRDGEVIATVSDAEYTDANRPPGTYAYTVVAVSPSGVSAASLPASATVAPDTTPPSVSIGAVCAGRTVHDYVGPIDGMATDDRTGEVAVRVDVDGTTIFGPRDLYGRFSFNWDTRTTTNGPHLMRVTARDRAGNETVQDCPWTVENLALSVPITGVADGATVSGTVTLGFQPLAGGQPTTAGVALQLDGAGLTSRAGSPYTYAWDTTQVANGVHTLKALMHWQDYPSPMATSTIQVRVENAPAAAPGLVAAYGFEETSGTTVRDSSASGSGTGTVSGATFGAPGRFGRALSFDGMNDVVTIADSSALDLAPGMTLSAWVQPAALGDWRTVLLKERPGSLTYALYAADDAGRPMGEAATPSMRDARGASPLPLGTWSHLALTYDRATLRLYRDGVQIASTAAAGSLVNSAGALRVGGNTVWGEWFKGVIDEVRVYERALSAAEIQADAARPVVAGTG